MLHPQRRSPKLNRGLFIGLTTFDIIYLSSQFPQPNQKVVATDYTMAAGGPATNAAVTFAYLGNEAHLLAVLGQHPLVNLIKTDLEIYNINLWDLQPDKTTTPPLSSTITTQGTGERAVISLNAAKSQASPQQIPAHIFDDIDIILIDGHQMAVSVAIASEAKDQGIPVVMDGGSWKPGLEKVLPFVDYAICSGNFYPPGCHHQKDIEDYLLGLGIKNIAITQGEKPIEYLVAGERGTIKVPNITPVDTLGAGDIFHGAFSHYILHDSFINSLAASAKIASQACQSFGTRIWLK
ncbi:MAG: PfkB family carbohydrate kinase [Spirulinaceae cyanobacterium]